MSSTRRSPFYNPQARVWRNPQPWQAQRSSEAREFHEKLPGYQPTTLHSLPDVAKSIGVSEVYLKDESSRLGLPAYKILGAFWGAFRAIIKTHGLSLDTDLSTVREALHSKPTTLFAATDGNHGRAVAFTARVLEIDAKIFVPTGLSPETIHLIENEGGQVTRDCGSYDDAVIVAHEASVAANGTLVQDTAFEGYEEIPNVSPRAPGYIRYTGSWPKASSKWIVEGYRTMFLEIEDQLGGLIPSLVVSPVGVGSLAQAVTSYYKAQVTPTAVLTVEPDSAACLWESLHKQRPDPIAVSKTIMDGMQCGTVSTIAWPILSQGVDMSITITDYEAHRAVEYLEEQGIIAGPCGAAALAAVQRLSDADKRALCLTSDSTIVLFCTEGARSYDIPHDVSFDSRRDSIVHYLAKWLEHRDIQIHGVESPKSKTSLCIVGQVKGIMILISGHNFQHSPQRFQLETQKAKSQSLDGARRARQVIASTCIKHLDEHRIAYSWIHRQPN